ncbi:MAG: bacteriochlorophyll c-binding family protein [Chlorobium sp.]
MWVVGDALWNVGKCTKRLGSNPYRQLYGGLSSGLRGSCHKMDGYAKPTKEVGQRFRDLKRQRGSFLHISLFREVILPV